MIFERGEVKNLGDRIKTYSVAVLFLSSFSEEMVGRLPQKRKMEPGLLLHDRGERGEEAPKLEWENSLKRGQNLVWLRRRWSFSLFMYNRTLVLRPLNAATRSITLVSCSSEAGNKGSDSMRCTEERMIANLWVAGCQELLWIDRPVNVGLR